MLRDPETLSLGYVNPFKPRSTGKTVPSSLENEEEWNGLIHHVRMFLAREKAKNRGRGGMTNPWTIILEDMGRDAGKVSSRVSGDLQLGRIYTDLATVYSLPPLRLYSSRSY